MPNQQVFGWGTARRYNAWADRCKELFGGRLQKVAIDAGFGCPNRDGTLGLGGCTFCNNQGFSPSYCRETPSVSEQIDKGVRFLSVRYPRTARYVAYFQAYSNTYAPLDVLKEKYQEALNHPAVSGLVVSTRPDCIPDTVLQYLSELSKQCYVKLELGLESTLDSTLNRINRGHEFRHSSDALIRAASHGISTGVHLILGLPGETREDMLGHASTLNKLPFDSIKLHQLQIVSGTAMGDAYQANPGEFTLFSLDEYIELVIGFAERLRPDVAIERFSGEVPPGINLGMSWGGLRTDQVIKKIEQTMEARDTWQGRLYNP